MVFVLERCEGLREGSNIFVLRDPDGFLFEANLLERDICRKNNERNPPSAVNYGTPCGYRLYVVLFFWTLGELRFVCWSTAWSFALSTFRVITRKLLVMVFGAQ